MSVLNINREISEFLYKLLQFIDGIKLCIFLYITALRIFKNNNRFPSILNFFVQLMRPFGNDFLRFLSNAGPYQQEFF